MKNATSPKTSKSIFEIDTYFSSLLKSQVDNNSANTIRRYKLIALMFLILVICASLYFAVSFYINASNPVGKDVVSENIGTAYFDPEHYSDTDRKISGKISRNLNNSAGLASDYELLDADGKILAFLSSSNHDLSLSAGLEVEIQGKYKRKAPNGEEIIEVTSIRLK